MSGAWQPVGSSVYAHDDLGRQTAITHKDGSGATLASYSYVLDDADRVTSQTIDGVTRTFDYDDTNQLTDDNGTAYTYDENGNRTTTGYVTGDGNRVTADGTWTYTYDDEGQLVKKSKGANAETWTYAYDHRGQLFHADKYANDAGLFKLFQGSVSYGYDAFGNRILRVEFDSGFDLVAQDRYVVDGWDTAKPDPVGTEAFDTVADLDAAGDVMARRVFGSGFDEVVARRDGSGTIGWYGTDGLGSVRAVFDNAGVAVESAAYDAWGTFLGGVPADRYGFAGREWDATLGLSYNRARMYDPALGRMQGEDQRKFAAGDANLYRYVGNDPVNRTDPSGLQPPTNPPGPRPGSNPTPPLGPSSTPPLGPNSNPPPGWTPLLGPHGLINSGQLAPWQQTIIANAVQRGLVRLGAGGEVLFDNTGNQADYEALLQRLYPPGLLLDNRPPVQEPPPDRKPEVPREPRRLAPCEPKPSPPPGSTLGDFVLEFVHAELDLLGLIPGFGEPADLLNAAIYALEGKYEEAAISAAGAIPFVGWVAAGGKWAKKFAKLSDAGLDKSIASLDRHLGQAREAGNAKRAALLKDGLDAAKEERARRAASTPATHAGAAAKGYPDIRMTPNGLGPDFAGTKYLKTNLAPGQKNIVKIKLQGSRYDDSKEANRLAGFKGAEPPEGYVWHHVADYDPATCEATMQLVEKAAHRATYPHKGSVFQYEKATGTKYK